MDDLNKYIIKDIIGKSCKRIFILESPHTTELKTKIPASGQTGIVISQELYNISTPVGIAIKNEEIQEAGILNACQFPLDEKAYTTIPTEFLSYLNIKKLKYSGNQYKSDIKEKIIEIDSSNTVINFRKRLDILAREKQGIEVIVCGLISQAYIELAYPTLTNVRFKTWTKLNISGNNINIRYTHHPSPKRNGSSWEI